MSEKERYSSLEHSLEQRQKAGLSGAAGDNELMSLVDRELDRLFEEFLASPAWTRSRKFAQKASVRPGSNAVASAHGAHNASEDLSAE